MYGLTTIAAPAAEPVTLAEAKAHLRIDHDAEDALVTGWVTAARMMVESYTGRRLIEQRLRLTLAAFPVDDRAPDARTGWTYGGGAAGGLIRLPVEPVSSVELVQYTDEGGTARTLAAGTGYQAWLDHSPPLLAPLPYAAWPSTRGGALQAVTVEFTAGYGPTAAAVPAHAKTAILLALGDWDKNRAGEGDPKGRGLPGAARALLDLLWTGSY